MNTDNIKKEIRKVKIGHIALLLAGIFVAFGLIGTLLVVFGGWQGTGFRLGNGIGLLGVGERFEVDDRADLDFTGVDKLVISTVSDSVTLLSGTPEAHLKGQCFGVGEPVKLVTRLSGSTLYVEVKYPMSMSSSSTSLTVTLPQDYAGDLKVNTVSGRIAGQDAPWALSNVNLSTVSGSVTLHTRSLASLDVNTTSGSVEVINITGPVKVDTVSGRVRLSYTVFAETRVSTVSGAVTATVPDDAAFTINFSSVSGRFTSTHPGLAISRADGDFTGAVGGGTDPLRVNTISGGFTLNGN